MDRYITTQGDMWDSISLHVYNTEKLIHVLIESNPEYRNIVIFPANCELNIPAISREERISFPAWRVR